MPDEIPDLWPADIRLDVRSPLVILKTQAELLSKHTKGLLECAVTTTEEGEQVQHALDLFARAVNYRERVFSAQHKKKEAYPVLVAGMGIATRTIDSEAEFLNALAHSLQSQTLRTIVDSLIAVINETKAP